MELLIFSIISCLLFFTTSEEVLTDKNKIFSNSARIIGGHVAYSYQFPFSAAIEVETSNSKHFCGGTLYGNQWIITAGQCVDRAILFTISLGSASLDKEDSSRLTVASSEYVLHPNYNAATLDNDIGLIKLRMKVEFTDFIKPITALAMNSLPDYSYLRAIGWGQTSDRDSSLSSELKYVYVTSLSNQECRIVYGNQITDNMVCIEGNYNEGICHGDTGSALVEAYGKYELVHVGVASFVSGNGCESTDPSGFTRTYPYVSWIKNITGT
jgi:secreted trypsin-like serine protease